MANVIATLRFSTMLVEIKSLSPSIVWPTANLVAIVWTNQNELCKHLHWTDLLPEALDQTLLSLKYGTGEVAIADVNDDDVESRFVIPEDRSRRIVAFQLQCPFVAKGQKFISSCYYTTPFLNYLQVVEEGHFGSFNEIGKKKAKSYLRENRNCKLRYGLKGGIDRRYEGLKLFPLISVVTRMRAYESGYNYTFLRTTNDVTRKYMKRVASISKIFLPLQHSHPFPFLCPYC